MKKFIIAAVLIAASGVTALSVAKNTASSEIKTVKIEKADFAGKNFSAGKSDISSAD